MTELPPCCADLEDPPCPQHLQAAALRREGPRLRHGSGSRVIGEPGKVRSVQPEEHREHPS